MTNQERAARALALAKETFFGYKVRPNSPRWNEIERLLEEIVASAQGPTPIPEPTPQPEPEGKYAPMSHHSTPSADARFCMSPVYGVKRIAGGFMDQKGILYDEAGRDLGGRSKRGADEMPFLKGANSMDGQEPCDPYVGPTGMLIGGEAGYPAKCFER